MRSNGRRPEGTVRAAASCLAIGLAGCGSHRGLAPDAATSDASVDVAPCADYSATNNLYWGDLHTHTTLSADAYDWGNRALPIDAYRFASDPSASVQIAAGSRNPGPSVSIDRALDFAAVTDHSEWLDAIWACGQHADGTPLDSASPYEATAQCTTLRGDNNVSTTKVLADAAAAVASMCDGGRANDPSCLAFTRSAWQVERQAAHDAYQRCKFTSLVAYEWTHAAAHQNVVFGSETVPDTPFDADEYQQPAELWSALEASCTPTLGCRVLTIPHNSNLSGGSSFTLPVGVDAMRQMNRYQRLVEIHQNKGNSECYAGSNATDPTCAFEHSSANEIRKAFVRTALATGLATYATSGVDPLQLGIVAGTDGHNGLPGYVEERNWQGHIGSLDDSPLKRLQTAVNNPGGLTGVWAPQNTREDIFAALYRREVFGTSGPRIAVRFYQVWDSGDYCSGGFPGNAIAAGGVPMGSTMPAPPAPGALPQLVVSALEDHTPLAEVDIIKDDYVGGTAHESVHRFTPATPNTTWSGGSVCLGWSDSGFAPQAAASYYVRVLETPTPRWSHYDCLAAPATPGCEAGGTLDVMIQERAWTSPIWWLP